MDVDDLKAQYVARIHEERELMREHEGLTAQLESVQSQIADVERRLDDVNMAQINYRDALKAALA